MSESKSKLSQDLVSILCCPSELDGAPCHGELQEGEQVLVCQRCQRRYPIEEGIPVLLPLP